MLLPRNSAPEASRASEGNQQWFRNTAAWSRRSDEIFETRHILLPLACVVIFVGALGPTMPHHDVVDQQHHDRADDCDNHAINVQACDTRCSKES